MSDADKTLRVASLHPVVFGIVPTTRELRDPALVRALAEALGPMWTVRLHDTYEDLVTALGRSEVDVAWLPPLAYARAMRRGKADLVLTLERANTASYASAIVVPEGSRVTQLSECAGLHAAWVDPWSAAGYLMARRMLAAAGVSVDTQLASQTFVGSHGGVIDALLDGRAQVGATFCSVDAMGSIVRCAWRSDQALRVLEISDAIPGDTICVAPRLGVREGRTHAARFVSLSASPVTRDLLLRTLGADRFVPGDPTQYEALALALGNEPSR